MLSAQRFVPRLTNPTPLLAALQHTLSRRTKCSTAQPSAEPSLHPSHPHDQVLSPRQSRDVQLFLRQKESNRLTPLKATVGETLLDVAKNNNINVDGTCDGKLECSTCHCIIADDLVLSSLPRITPREDDLLQSAWAVGPRSRLACQARVSENMSGVEISFPGASDNVLTNPTSTSENTISSFNLLREAIKPKKFTIVTKRSIPSVLARYMPHNMWTSQNIESTVMLSNILPFRTNNYVLEELIDWSRVPDDPMFQLNFPQPGMLPEWPQVQRVQELLKAGAPPATVRQAADQVRGLLNPHPAKQVEMNVPLDSSDSGNVRRAGLQHKYRETALFFPSEAQYCHSYCTYCFRWPQFVGWQDAQFSSNDLINLQSYLRENRNITDVLFTGGDPMVMNSRQIGRYLKAICADPSLEHVQTIRIGSKSLAYWPYKYVTDADAGDMLRTLEQAVNCGKHVAFMAHFTHPVELSTPVVQEAISRIRSTGATIRCQAPLVDHVNNDPQVWETMWREQVRLGMVPYYMFVERDTGANQWFSVPLVRALEVYQNALHNLSGLARTARGPSMSCTPGKVRVMGVEKVGGEKVFVLQFLQARNPKWAEKVFFARFDPLAAWMDDLKPAFGDQEFFFEGELRSMEERAAAPRER